MVQEVPAANVNSFRLAPDVRIVATRDGAIVSTSKGFFRLNGYSTDRFVSEVLPALFDGGSSIDSWRDLHAQLEHADIIRGDAALQLCAKAPELRVGVIRWTPLMERVREHLARLGMDWAESDGDNIFAIADLSGLNTDHSLEIARELHQRDCPSLSIWKRGHEIFYGPLVEPGRTACWNCCRLRFSDSLAGEYGAVEDDATTAKVIADNVLLAIRYPQVAGYGCLVAGNGQMSSFHSVVPMPWCEICGAAITQAAARLAPLTHSLHVPEELRILADPRGGIVRRLFLYEGDETGAPRMPLCCSASIASYQDGVRSYPEINGEGKGATRDEAVRSAIGEGIERYAASLWNPSTLSYAPLREIADQAFDPRWLVLYDNEQYAQPEFPFARFDADQPIHWTRGRWLDTGEAAQVPALAAYMNFPAPPAEQFCQVSSNGLAAGATFEDAALRALYELIERDALMFFWLARRPAQRLAEDGCGPVAAQALREVERLGARTELYLIDAGTRHPTVVCLGLGDGYSWPGATIGLGTHADIDIALRRAVLEHGHCGTYIRRLMREGRHEKIRDRQDVETGLDHALYYVDPERVGALDSFRSSTQAPASLADLRTRYRQDATLPDCVFRLREAGIRTAAVDVTSPDVALAPVRVVRAFGVNMQPVHFGFRNRRLKNPRLDGWLVGAAEMNPHPLA